MSTFAATAEVLTILPHPNADALELAQVGGYHAVVGKGQYQTGDVAVYIPESALLPDALIEEMGLVGRLAGGAKNRVKAIRLRGELSQGLVHRPAFELTPGQDYAKALGITKYEPVIPTSMSGTMVGASSFVPMFEVENIKRYPEMFVPGEPVTATEKVHGTNIGVTLDGDELLVASKGVGQKLFSLAESTANLYWQAVRAHDVEAKLREAFPARGQARIALFAEVYGEGVQDLTYGVARGKPGLAVFDLWQEGYGFLDQDEAEALCCEVGLPMVPRLYEGPYDYEVLTELAEGKTVIGGEVHLREGIVVRPLRERTYAGTWGRAIVKFVSAAYLTRGGEGTEFE
jgi:RNA ligase (TIGR02306 family)